MQTLASEHIARRARLGIPAPRAVAVSPILEKAREIAADRPRELVFREIPRAVPVEDIIAAYRVSFDSEPPADLLKPREKRITVNEIVRAVCEVRGVRRNDLLSHRRQRFIVAPRHEACWLARELTLLSYPEIARQIGDRDHTTIMWGVKSHQAKIDAGLVDSLRDIKPAIDAARAAKVEAGGRA